MALRTSQYITFQNIFGLGINQINTYQWFLSAVNKITFAIFIIYATFLITSLSFYDFYFS